jgi:hypothetical protein
MFDRALDIAVWFVLVMLISVLGYTLHLIKSRRVETRLLDRECKALCDPYGMHNRDGVWCVCGGAEGPTVKRMEEEKE